MVVQLAVPVIMQGVINLGVNIMDTVMLAHYGEIQLSASSLAGGYINLFQILCMGIGCGAAVLTSQCWGRRDIVSLKKTVALMLRLALGISAVFTLLTWMVPGIIIRIYTPDAEIIEKGVLYLRWSVITFPLMGLSLTLTQVLRSIRNVRIPLAASIISFVANIFFNWVFIFGNLGAPEMQIAGAALGTSIARVIETIIIAGYMFFLENKIHFRLPALLEPCGSLLPTYLHYSLPVIISDSLLALGTNMVSVIMGAHRRYFCRGQCHRVCGRAHRYGGESGRVELEQYGYGQYTGKRGGGEGLPSGNHLCCDGSFDRSGWCPDYLSGIAICHCLL